MRTEPVPRVTDALREYLVTPIDRLLARHTETNAHEAALALFRSVVGSVPAYQAFLAERGIDPAAVRTVADFRRLPLLTKQNYVQRYPLADLCRGGRLDSCDMVAVSSGSTGQPTVWPRSLVDELPVAARFEQVFHDSFRVDERPNAGRCLLCARDLGWRHVHRQLLSPPGLEGLSADAGHAGQQQGGDPARDPGAGAKL